jgi:hypothetical protein
VGWTGDAGGAVGCWRLSWKAGPEERAEDGNGRLALVRRRRARRLVLHRDGEAAGEGQPRGLDLGGEGRGLNQRSLPVCLVRSQEFVYLVRSKQWGKCVWEGLDDKATATSQHTHWPRHRVGGHLCSNPERPSQAQKISSRDANGQYMRECSVVLPQEVRRCCERGNACEHNVAVRRAAR